MYTLMNNTAWFMKYPPCPMDMGVTLNASLRNIVAWDEPSNLPFHLNIAEFGSEQLPSSLSKTVSNSEEGGGLPPPGGGGASQSNHQPTQPALQELP